MGVVRYRVVVNDAPNHPPTRLHHTTHDRCAPLDDRWWWSADDSALARRTMIVAVVRHTTHIVAAKRDRSIDPSIEGSCFLPRDTHTHTPPPDRSFDRRPFIPRWCEAVRATQPPRSRHTMSYHVMPRHHRSCPGHGTTGGAAAHIQQSHRHPKIRRHTSTTVGVASGSRGAGADAAPLIHSVVRSRHTATPRGDRYDDSVLVVVSDNGGAVSSGASNWPLRGQKYTLWEGGVRVPAFVHSPLLDGAARGRVTDALFHAQVGGRPPPLSAASSRGPSARARRKMSWGERWSRVADALRFPRTHTRRCRLPRRDVAEDDVTM